MIDVSRLTPAERSVLTEALVRYADQQRRIIVRSTDAGALADGKWRMFVARQLRETIDAG